MACVGADGSRAKPLALQTLSVDAAQCASKKRMTRPTPTAHMVDAEIAVSFSSHGPDERRRAPASLTQGIPSVPGERTNRSFDRGKSAGAPPMKATRLEEQSKLPQVSVLSGACFRNASAQGHPSVPSGGDDYTATVSALRDELMQGTHGANRPPRSQSRRPKPKPGGLVSMQAHRWPHTRRARML